MVLSVGGETSGWSICIGGFFGCESGSILMGDAVPTCGAVCMRRRVRLVGLGGDGGRSPWVGVCVTVLFGCQGLPCGRAAAAAMLWLWCSHEFVKNAVRMPSIRQPLSHSEGGVPIRSHLRRAL